MPEKVFGVVMKERIYICHTYYHVYVTFLKECKLRREGQPGQATLVLSALSTDFEQLKSRVEQTGLFEAVFAYDEKRDDFFPQLTKWRQNTGSFVRNMIQRIRFTRQFAKLQEPYIPVDLKAYGAVYVYCDSDPIGYYLNQNKIYYHALEDGLNCLKNYDSARYDNRGHFAWKAFFSKQLNLIFIQNGYGKYCIDMEVNDLSLLRYPGPCYIEQSRQALSGALTQSDKDLILQAFIRDRERLQKQLAESAAAGKAILILTDPLCTLDIRRQIFADIISRYEKEGQIFIKPHPRDTLDYRTLFAKYPQFDPTVPMELLNFFPHIRFAKVVAVLTEVGAIGFADEVIRLGEDFMDAYEEPAVHRQNEQIG